MNVDQDHNSSLKGEALALIRNKRFEDAKTQLTQICVINPKDAEAWYMLSSINGMLGRIDEAENCCRRVLAIEPQHSEALLNLGNVLLYQGKHDEAVMHYESALQINPNNAGARCSLGNSLASVGRHDEAVVHYQAAIRLNPNIVETYYNLGNSLLAQKKYGEAVENYRHVLRLNPNYAEAYNNLGNAFKELGNSELAIDNYRNAISLKPDHATAYNNLSITLRAQGDMQTATDLAQRALQIQPNLHQAYFNLSNIRFAQLQIREAKVLLQRTLEIKPDLAEAYCSLLMLMHYLPEYTAEDLYTAAKDWVKCLGTQKLLLQQPTNSLEPQRRLRIGYVSGDFYHHVVGRLVRKVLEQHDKSSFEIFCYYNHRKQDSLTAHLRESVDHWRNIIDNSDEDLAQQIRLDSIDILIDLSGHTKGNRLSTFALKPAPVQATWLGYFDTTGLTTMDYIIADRYTILQQEECFYTEKVVRLPNALYCYTPPEYPIIPSSPPALAEGKITFGCFNNPAKLNEAVIACWSRLLLLLPEAQLLLKYPMYANVDVRQRYQNLFSQNGIAPERILFAGSSSHDQYLSAYQEVDIGLDPYPFNGCGTTLDALWMGVPIINLSGNRYSGHMGESILTNCGLNEYVADTEDDYIAKAIALATDLPRLTELRSRLRTQLLNSPICDGQSFTRHLEIAYRSMWQTWCQTQ